MNRGDRAYFHVDIIEPLSDSTLPGGCHYRQTESIYRFGVKVKDKTRVKVVTLKLSFIDRLKEPFRFN